MSCPYSRWGWALPVAQIYIAAVVKLGGDEYFLEYGPSPSHAVWCDANFEDHNILWALNEIATNRGAYDNHSDADMAIVRESLEALLRIPEAVRCPWSDEDEESEELAPPPGVAVMDEQARMAEIKRRVKRGEASNE